MKLQECLKSFEWGNIGAEEVRGPIQCRNQSYVRDWCKEVD